MVSLRVWIIIDNRHCHDVVSGDIAYTDPYAAEQEAERQRIEGNCAALRYAITTKELKLV